MICILRMGKSYVGNIEFANIIKVVIGMKLWKQAVYATVITLAK